MAEEVGAAAVEAGDFVAMGCPNVVRGGSHLGWASAARLAEAGICTRADVRLLLSGDDARGVRSGEPGGDGSGAGMGADFGKPGRGPED